MAQRTSEPCADDWSPKGVKGSRPLTYLGRFYNHRGNDAGSIHRLRMLSTNEAQMRESTNEGQTRDEKIAMYMKLTKQEIVEMLVNANEAVFSLQKSIRPPEFIPWSRQLRCAACKGDGGRNRSFGWETCAACCGWGY